VRGQTIVYETLERMGIRCEAMEHDPVFTVTAMEKLPFPDDVGMAKNLFLRDAKGRRHFLVTLRKDAVVDLKALEKDIGCSRLSFASEERLDKYLKLTKGSVSPLGVLNDETKSVEVIFDDALRDYARVGVHPNDNSATLFIPLADLEAIVGAHGNSVCFVSFPS